MTNDAYANSSALTSRLTSLRFAAAFVLAGFLFNAGIAVLLVAYVSKSVLASLIALAVMATFVGLLALYSEAFHLSATGARRLQPGEFPWLTPMVRKLSDQMRIPEPEVLVSDQEAINAYTTGIGGRAKIVFMAGLLDMLPQDEVRAVAAHELGHVLNRDVSLGVWSWAVSGWVAFIGFLAFMLAGMVTEFSKHLPETGEGMGPIGALLAIVFAGLGFFIAGFIWVATQAWTIVSRLASLGVTRQREYLADATAVAITGDARPLASALATIAQNPGLARGASRVGRFCIVRPELTSGWWDELLSTHPAPERRIDVLNRLASAPPPAIDANWQGIGSLSWLLPVGSLCVLGILAIAIAIYT